MNDIQNLIDRQLGFHCRFNYDNVLKRLMVSEEETFYGLQDVGVPIDSFDQDPPIFACRFAEASWYEQVLALANEDGRVAIQDTSSVTTAKQVDSFQCHNNAVFDLAWMPGNLNFVTVSGDHTACLWDVSSGAPRRVSTFAGHSKSVKTAVFRPEEPSVFATGARDGHVLVWDTRVGARPGLAVTKPDNRLLGCHSGLAPKTPTGHGKRARLEPRRAVGITGLAFSDAATLLSCGECDGGIKAWDLRKSYGSHSREPLPRHSIPYCGGSAKCGYTNLLVDRARRRLYASCMDDVVYCFDVATYAARPERRYTGHENGTFYIKTGLSPDGAYLVSGSSDKMAYVWNVECSMPVTRLAAHRAEVTCAAWGPRGAPTLVTCSDDARHMIWRVGGERAAPAAGRAEPAPRRAQHTWPRTPTSCLKRAAPAARSPPAHERARARPAPSTARKTKRCLTDLFCSKEVDEAESTVKRMKLDDNVVEAPPSRGKRSHPGGDEGEGGDGGGRGGSPKRPAGDSPWTYTPQAGTSFLTPTKNYEAKSCRHLSPKNLKSPLRSPSPHTNSMSISTPTKDLPNFVLNGEAPHLRLMSPVKKKVETTDWLTLLRERKGKVDGDKKGKEGDIWKMEGEKSVPAPQSPRENIPPRRSSLERTPKSNKKSRTLLKYFSVAAKDKR